MVRFYEHLISRRPLGETHKAEKWILMDRFNVRSLLRNLGKGDFEGDVEARKGKS